MGTGKVTGKPDVARVTVGIETQAPSLQKAVDDNKAKMSGLLETLKKLGLADKDIRTSNYSVYTERVSPPSAGAEVSTDQMIYHVTNQVDVTVRDVNQLGDVLDKAVAAGANNIYGVNFSVEDTAKLEADRPAKVIFAIVTDGKENASTEVTQEQIKKMIKAKTEDNEWQIAYLSTDPSASDAPPVAR